MIKNKNLLVDKNCPLCVFYGDTFTKTGLIDSETVQPYQTIEDNKITFIDMVRAKNEIALFDKETNKTVYGVDALIEIISQENKSINSFLKSAFVYKGLKKLYKFISFNRKVIFPTKKIASERDCTPDVNKTYRFAYIFLTAIFTGIILGYFVNQLTIGLGFSHSYFWEIGISFAQIVWQTIFLSLSNREKLLEYLGNMSTVSFLGGILLIPLLVLHSFIELNTGLFLSGFALVVLTIFMEHIRRCKLLELSLWITFSWVAFRIVLLAIILTSIY